MSTFVQGHALLVGVGADLSCTVNDAKGVRDILVDPARCAYPQDNVCLLTEEHATASRIRDELKRLAQVISSESQPSTVIVYFSGHGFQAGSRFYLLPWGGDYENLDQRVMEGSEFIELLTAIRSQRFLLLLDCCHAGRIDIPKGAGIQPVDQPLSPEIRKVFAGRRGRALIASSTGTEKSWVGKPYSAFTTSLLEALCGKGNLKGDGFVRISDIVTYVSSQVPAKTQQLQHPDFDFSQADNFEVAYYGAGSKEPKGLPFPEFRLEEGPEITPSVQIGSVDRSPIITAPRGGNYTFNMDNRSESTLPGLVGGGAAGAGAAVLLQTKASPVPPPVSPRSSDGPVEAPSSPRPPVYAEQRYVDRSAIRCERCILKQFGVAATEEQLASEAVEHGHGWGTLEDVGELLEAHGIEVHREFNASVLSLALELAQGHKVIVGLHSGDEWHTHPVREEIAHACGIDGSDHAVIVAGIDTSDPDHICVALTDPATGDTVRSCPLPDFLEAWRGSHFAMVATNEPVPAIRPEMVNFDYEAGHIAHVGQMPYDLAYEMAVAAVHEHDPGAIHTLEHTFMHAIGDGSANHVTALGLSLMTDHGIFQDVTEGLHPLSSLAGLGAGTDHSFPEPIGEPAPAPETSDSGDQVHDPGHDTHSDDRSPHAGDEDDGGLDYLSLDAG